MCRVDMHIHTDASDGSWNIEQLINKIQAENIKIFSVTDHNTIKNSKELLLNEQYHLPNTRFILGVELSTRYEGKEYHITAYNFDINNKELNNLLEYTHKQLDDADDKVVDYVFKAGRLQSIDDYDEYDDTGKGGWKALNYLKDKGIINNYNDFFDIANECNAQAVFKHPSEIINIVNQAGGKCFLAHPSAYDDGDLMPIHLLDVWRELGVDGIECYSPYLKDIKESKYYIDYCNKYNLLISAGSDCHGEFVDRKLGYPVVSLNDLNLGDILNPK